MGSRSTVGIGALLAVLAAAPWWMPAWLLFIASNALAKGLGQDDLWSALLGFGLRLAGAGRAVLCPLAR